MEHGLFSYIYHFVDQCWCTFVFFERLIGRRIECGLLSLVRRTEKYTSSTIIMHDNFLFWILVMNLAFMNYIWNWLFLFEISVALLYDIKIETGLFYIWSSNICDIFLIFFWLTIFSRESSYIIIILLNIWWSSSSQIE